MRREKIDLATLVVIGGVWRELVTVTFHLDLNVGVLLGKCGYACFEAMLADVAPRAGNVAPDVDSKGVIHTAYSVPRRKVIPLRVARTLHHSIAFPRATNLCQSWNGKFYAGVEVNMIRDAQWPKPLHLLMALVALVLGLVLILVGLTVQQIAMVTGIGIVAVGVTLVLRALGAEIDREERESPKDAIEFRDTDWISQVAGAALIIVGTLMAIWPDAGTPWLAFAVAISLIAHGIISAVAAFRGSADRRLSGVLIAFAGVALGVLAFSWPVLTLVLFRLGVGAWLMFHGLRTLLMLWQGRVSRAEDRAQQASSGRESRIARWPSTLASALALLLAVGAVYGSAQLLGGTPQPVPDAFYTAPGNVSSKPGQLIRTEPLTIGVPQGAQAWKMLYTTTHPDGSPAVSSGTILAPAKLNGSRLPLLTVSHGTTGIAVSCAPSLGATPFDDGAGTAMQQMVTEHGWVAVTSDYVGMGTAGTAAYLVGDAEARNVLDASLAARQFDKLSLSSDTVIWGHSQGGQGSLWAGQIATDYAPELNVIGIAAFAPAADLFGLANADKNTGPGKTISAYIAKTWNTLFPKLELQKHLTPGSKGPVERISQLCFNGIDALSAILSGTQVPNQLFPESMLAGDLGELLKEQTPVGPFPAPVLVAQGLADPLVRPSLQQQWIDDRCDAGIAIDYRTFVGLSHVSLVAADSPLTPQIVQWTLDRWNGEAAPTECTSKEYPQDSKE